MNCNLFSVFVLLRLNLLDQRKLTSPQPGRPKEASFGLPCWGEAKQKWWRCGARHGGGHGFEALMCRSIRSSIRLALSHWARISSVGSGVM